MKAIEKFKKIATVSFPHGLMAGKSYTVKIGSTRWELQEVDQYNNTAPWVDKLDITDPIIPGLLDTMTVAQALKDVQATMDTSAMNQQPVSINL